MIYITGDIHADYDIHKLSSTQFPEGLKLTKKDYVIVCGDFGLVWDPSDKITNTERYWTEWLSSKPWTTLFVDGNHENHPRLNSYPVEEKFGGKVHKITDSIYHLMRGEYYEIEGKTFWTMGGATSHDIYLRIKDIDWWMEEMPSWEEMSHGVETLAYYKNRVDYIITHCLPTSKQNELCSWFKIDGLNSYFEKMILSEVKFKRWYCGHYHQDRDIGDNFTVLYNTIQKIE
jgi:hypothetical protein